MAVEQTTSTMTQARRRRHRRVHDEVEGGRGTFMPPVNIIVHGAAMRGPGRRPGAPRPVQFFLGDINTRTRVSEMRNCSPAQTRTERGRRSVDSVGPRTPLLGQARSFLASVSQPRR